MEAPFPTRRGVSGDDHKARLPPESQPDQTVREGVGRFQGRTAE